MSANYYNSLGELNNDYYYQYYGITQGPLPDGTIRGMPYAYTHRLVGPPIPGFISSDGYSNPDSGSQVYIGFPRGSPSLTQTLPNLPDNPGVYVYAAWVSVFFSDLMYYQMTVRDALDSACQYFWGTSFVLSPLSQYSSGGGFKPYWYVQGQNPDNWPICWMNIYGNSYIQLPLQPPLNTINILPNTGGYTDPPARLYTDSGTMQITAYAESGYAFSYWLLDDQYYSADPTINIDYSGHTVQPVFVQLAPFHELSVEAWSFTYGQLDAWWDSVPEGWHTISVPYTLTNPNDWYSTFVGFEVSTANYYYIDEVTISVYVDSDTYVTAYYYP